MHRLDRVELISSSLHPPEARDEGERRMKIEVINFHDKFRRITEFHKYKVVAQMNNYYFKLVKAQREFIWHQHPETDETFVLIDGSMHIELRDQTLQLHKGEMVVIPKGVEHRPICREVCHLLLIEPTDTVNTGDTGGKLTDTTIEWV